MAELEKGTSDNIQRTVRNHKVVLVKGFFKRFICKLLKVPIDKNIEEVLVTNKKTKEVVTHTVNGESANMIKLDEKNAPILSTKYLEGINVTLQTLTRITYSIQMQLLEMNYYTSYLEPKAKKTGKQVDFKEYLKTRGFEIEEGKGLKPLVNKENKNG